MRELRTEIKIKTSVSRVWEVLTDFDRYPEWNPFVPDISGELERGARLNVLLTPPGQNGIRLKPVVRDVEQQKTFRWLGHLLIPGLFDGEHIFELEPLAGGSVRFVQREVFRGILVGLFRRMLDTSTRQGFMAMNEALKKRAEESTGRKTA